MLKPSLTDIDGVGTQTAAALASHGIKNLETLARVPLEDVTAIPGFGPTRATHIQAAAEILLRTWAESKGKKQAAQDPSVEEAATQTGPKDDQPPKKKAKKKKKKGGDKKKKDKKAKGKKGKKGKKKK